MIKLTIPPRNWKTFPLGENANLASAKAWNASGAPVNKPTKAKARAFTKLTIFLLKVIKSFIANLNWVKTLLCQNLHEVLRQKEKE